MSELPEFKVDRVFDAPRELVWKAWTDPEILHRWYGPNIETVIHKFELKPGGVWLNEMKMDAGSDFSKVTFQEVTPPEKLVWHHSPSDSDWNIISSPMMKDWPRVLLTTVTFEELEGKTSVSLSQIPMDATEAEINCFAAVMDNMKHGWGSGYSIIDEILVELQK